MILFSENPETQEVTSATPVVAAEELEQIELEAAVEPSTDAPAQKADVEADDGLDIEDSTRLYLREIARVPLLSAEEEVVLAKGIELGLRIRTEP